MAANPRDPRASPHGGAWYSYAIVRIVPHVERGEFVNVGVILFARTLGFLEARFALDEDRVRCLWPEVDLPAVVRHLDSIDTTCRGLPEAGPFAAQSPSERFHWLTSPRSTVVQPSPVHVGRCDDPNAALEDLVARYVRIGPSP
jgi:hypothetical protein